MKVAVLGALCRDSIVLPSSRRPIDQVGGGVLYASWTLACLGLRVTAVPILAAADATLLEALSHPRIDVRPCWTDETTAFELIYSDTDPDAREIRATSEARDASVSGDVWRSWDAADGIHVAPLTAHELSTGSLSRLRQGFAGTISLDGQGLVRGAAIDAERELSGAIDILKVDEDEVLRLSGETDESRATARLISWGIREVVVTRGSRGSTIYTGEGQARIRAHTSPAIVDTTGCGDTYAAAYLAGRLGGRAPRGAGQLASIIAARKLSVRGPLRPLET